MHSSSASLPPHLSLIALLLPLLLLLLSSSPSSAQITSWSQVSITSLSSPNCTQAGRTVINCPFPVTLQILTTGWGSLSLNGLYLVATGPDGTEIAPAQGGGGSSLSVWAGDGGANSTLQGTLFPQQYAPSLVAASPGATAPILNVTLRVFFSQAATPPFPGISFAYDSGPTLTAISGCTGSGASTTACVPASTVLTFQGSGFRWYSNPGAVQLWINTGSTTVAGQGGGGGGQPALTVVSDSVMTLSLANAYTYTLLPVHYGGVLVPIFFNEQRYSPAVNSLVNTYTNTLQVSFVPQPAPNITSVASGGFGVNACRGTNGTGPYTLCTPLVSYLNIYGQYMYDMAVTVGGVPCATLVVQNAGLVRCLLPILPGVGPYDLVVSDPVAATTNFYTSTGLISYTSQPTLAAVTTCTDTGAVNMQGFYFGGLCYEGTTITVSGANFPVADSTVQVMAVYQYGFPSRTLTVYCGNPAVVSSTAITCTLPYLNTVANASLAPPQTLYGNAAVQLSFASGTLTSNTLNLQLYIAATSPVIYSVTGCAVSNGALQMSYCGSGSLITITGANFLGGQPYISVQGQNAWTCTVRNVSASQVICSLPFFDLQVAPVTDRTVYALNLNTFNQSTFTNLQSNAFRIAYILVQPSSWAQVQILSVSSTSSCVTQGNVSVNCAFPATVSIQTSGWGQLNLATTFLVVTGPDGTEIGGFGGGGGGTQIARSPLDLGSNTTLQATIYPQAYSPTLAASATGAVAPMLNVTLRSWVAGGSSTPGFAGISFAYDSGPTLTSISGCTGSGASTAGCVPTSTVLTFQGSGFNWYSNAGAVQLWLNNGYTTVSGQGGGGGQGGQPALVVVSDSLMTVNMANAYTYTLLPVHYGGVLVPIFFNEQRWSPQAGAYVNSYTNTLQVSFIPQPPPVVTGLLSGPPGPNACQGTNGTGPYTGCIPLVSYIGLQGQYLYDVSVTVGGVPCATLVVQNAGYVRCLLPQLSGSGSYDLVVSDPNAQTAAAYTSTGVVSYTANPTINSVTTCTDTGAVNQQGFYFGGLCAEGATITITGVNLPTSSTPTVTAMWTPNLNPNNRPPWGQNAIPVVLLNPTVVSSTAITATLPVLSTLTGASANASLAFPSNNVQLTVAFATGATTNSLTLQLYAVPGAPVVSSVSGCSSTSSALLMTNCPSGSVLTISGSNLAASNAFWGPVVAPVTAGFAQWSCSVTSSSATQITCTLPTFDVQVTPVQSGVVYPITVYINPGGSFATPWATSNAFRLSYNFGGSSSPSSSSSGLSTGAIVAIAVVVPIAGLTIIAVLVCLMLRGKKGGGGGGGEGGSDFSSDKPSSTGSGFGKHVDEPTDVEMQ